MKGMYFFSVILTILVVFNFISICKIYAKAEEDHSFENLTTSQKNITGK